MINFVKEIIKLRVELTEEEKCYISIAYKCLLAKKRIWRVFSSYEQREISKGNIR